VIPLADKKRETTDERALSNTCNSGGPPLLLLDARSPLSTFRVCPLQQSGRKAIQLDGRWYMYASYTTQPSSMTTPTPKIPRVVVRQDYCDDRCLTQLSVSSSCIFNTSRDDLSTDITYERPVDSCDNIKFPGRVVADTRSLTRRLSARNLASFDDVPAFQDNVPSRVSR
jgi:hypothetical protein